MTKISKTKHITKDGVVKKNPKKNVMYEVVFDTYGKPYSMYASNDKELEELLKKGFSMAQEDDGFDIKIYQGDKDISESQFIQEMIAEIMNKKKFKATWSKEIYSNAETKIVTMDFITEGNGFNEEDIDEINNLEIGEKFIEAHPLGPGLILKRIE